jgi:hypothetical protein
MLHEPDGFPQEYGSMIEVGHRGKL